MKSVFICDDHSLFLDGEVSFLSKFPSEFAVVGTAHNGTDALNLILQKAPDLVLLDLNLPRLSGIDVLKALRAAGSESLVIVLTSYNDVSLMKKVKSAGANAYLLKTGDQDELLETMRNLSADKFINGLKQEEKTYGDSEKDKFTEINSLTARETELVKELASGASSAQAAERLFISENTVKNHRKNIYRKLGINSIQELILYCKDNGLLD